MVRLAHEVVLESCENRFLLAPRPSKVSFDDNWDRCGNDDQVMQAFATEELGIWTHGRGSRREHITEEKRPDLCRGLLVWIISVNCNKLQSPTGFQCKAQLCLHYALPQLTLDPRLDALHGSPRRQDGKKQLCSNGSILLRQTCWLKCCPAC